MCLIVFAWQAHPGYRLILAANRDELHARPSREAGWWPDQPQVLAGRDLQAGGTWLGIHQSGRFATVTNYREHQRQRPGLRSRGEIVTNFISGRIDPLSFVASIADGPYSGVSTLAADRHSICYASNRGDEATTLVPGVYGLGNASLDTPWSKIVRSKEALNALIDSDRVNRTELLRILADRTMADEPETSGDGMPFRLARALTAPFIVADDYGTRCSTVLLISNDGEVEFFERRFDARGDACGDSSFRFSSE